MPKIYVKERGFVITNDLQEIEMLLAEGGRVVVKNREIDQPIDDLVETLTSEPAKERETPETFLSEPAKERETPKPVNKFKSKLR